MTQMTDPDQQSRPVLPKWLVVVICAAIVIIVAAVIAILVVVTNSAKETAEREAAAEASAIAEQARLDQLKDAVLSCDVDASTVTEGGRKFEATKGFGGNVKSDDVKCILAALNAPESVTDLTYRVSAGDPPKSSGWGDFTYTLHYPKWLADTTVTIEFNG